MSRSRGGRRAPGGRAAAATQVVRAPAPGSTGRSDPRSRQAAASTPVAASGAAGVSGFPLGAATAAAPAVAQAWWPAPAPQPVPVVEAPARLPRPRNAAEAALALRRGLGAIAICAAMAGALAWAAIAVSVKADAVQAMQGRVAVLLDQNLQLQARLAALQSPARIESQAVQRLGLQRPAAYVPVPVVPVKPTPPRAGASSVQMVLPVPPGPLPGSPVALWRAARTALTGLWRRVAG